MSTRKRTSTRSALCTDLCTRVSGEPIISPADVTPSDPRLQVIGVLNPAFVHTNGRRRLIVRVDERPVARGSPDGTIVVARMNTQSGGLEFLDVPVPHSYARDIGPLLPKSVRQRFAASGKPELLLSYISHLRIAELEGIQATVSDTPLVFPHGELTEYGVEDPRSATLEGTPALTYTGISRHGATTWSARIGEAGTLHERAILLGPDHKHAALFPQTIDGYYHMLCRPLNRSYLRSSGVWLLRSPDLLHWGSPAPVLLPRPGMWDSERVGPCTGPFLTRRGWLFFYYGVDAEDSYQVGCALLDAERPDRLIARSERAVLSPILEWERTGRRADTVFPCGVEVLPDSQRVRLFYGAADKHVGAAELDLPGLLDSLRAVG